MAFDVDGALKAGYSRADIADYLASKENFDISGARKAGYSDDDVISHLSLKSAAVKAEPAPEEKSNKSKVSSVDNPLNTKEPSLLDKTSSIIKDILGTKSSVMENAPAVEAKPDTRLSLGQGPISQEALRKARDVREGLAKTDDEGILRIAQALKNKGERTARSVVEQVMEPERIAEEVETQRRKQFARENPITGALTAGTATTLSGGLNVPSVAADAFNQTFVNPVLEAAGFQPIGRTPTALGTEYLAKSAEEYMPSVAKQKMGEAFDKGEATNWLITNLAANSPQIAQSLVGAYAPALRASILPSMGASAAGTSYAAGDDSRVAVAKGGIEVLTEMLPLQVFDKVGDILKGLSVPKQKAIMAVAGQRLLAAGTDLTAISITNAVEEAAAQFGGNVLDKYFQGKDVKLTDDLAEAAVLGAASGAAIATPRAATNLLAPRSEQDYTPEQQFARALEADVAGKTPAGTQAAAIAALNPETYDPRIVSPNETVFRNQKLNELKSATSVDQIVSIADDLAGTVGKIETPPVAPIVNAAVAPITNVGRIEPTLTAEPLTVPPVTGRIEPTLEPVTQVAVEPAIEQVAPSAETEQKFGLDKLRAAPRPQRILGRNVDDLTDDDLRGVVENDNVSAITRRGAQIELDARAAEATPQVTETQNVTAETPAIEPATQVPDTSTTPVGGVDAANEARATAQTAINQWAAANGITPFALNQSGTEEDNAVNQIANALDSQFGNGKIYSFNDANPEAPNGFALGGVAFVNTYNPDFNIANTSLHEFKHTIEQIAEAETKAGKTGTAAQQFVQSIDSIFDDMSEEGKRSYVENFLAAAELRAIADPAAREQRLQQIIASKSTRSEMTADFFGNRATDKGFWRDLAKADPEGFKGFVERWLNVINNMIATLQGQARKRGNETAKVDKYVRDLKAAKAVARDALIAYRRGTLVQEAAEAGDLVQSMRQGEQGESNIPAREAGVQPSAERTGQRAGETGRGEIPSYGEPIEGAISVIGRHYSPRVQTSLNGNYYGTGLRGAESGRLREAKDPRISNRIYFYVDTGKGIRPESGVGRFAHEVKLNNIYDPASRLIPPQGSANAFESAVINAGFDGYIAPFGLGSAVVLLGTKHRAVPVQALETPAFSKKQEVAEEETVEPEAIEPEKDLGVFRSVAKSLGLSDAEYKASALGLMTGKTKSEAFETPRVGGIPPVVEWLDKRYRDAGMTPLDLNKPDDRTTVARMMAAEAVAAIKSAGNAVEWYDETVRKTLSIMAVKYPELDTDQNARNAFLMATAISSQTMNVEDNLRYASNQYEAFRQTGEFPEMGTGKSAPAMANNFALANALLKDMGPDLLRRFLQTEVTKRELESMGFSIGGESMDEKMLGSAVFGPKIGFGFYSNLSGNFEPVTMDMWFMRTVGRLTGRLPSFDEDLFEKQVAKLRAAIAETGDSSKGLFAADFDQALVDEAMQSDDGAIALARAVNSLHNRQFIKERAKFDSGERKKTALVGAAGAILKSADKPKDAPKSGGERQRLRDVVRQMVDLVEKETGKRVPPAALQALIWYPEQELYKKLGVKLRVTSQDYAGAAKSLLTKEGFDGKRISAAAKSGSGSTRQVAGGKVAGTNQTLGATGKSTGPLQGKEREAFIQPRVAKALVEEANALPLEEIFTKLDKRGIAKANAEKIVARRNDAARIKYVQDNFLDILSELEDSGKVEINCD
jgi:hypothetical protein